MSGPPTPEACRAEQERVLRQMADVLRLLLSGDEAMVQAGHVDIRRIYTNMGPAHATLLGAYAEALERERWIPVEERLPEEGVWVLVATHEVSSLGYFRYAQTAYFLDGKWHQVNGSVRHWRPLPAPPAPASAGGAE